MLKRWLFFPVGLLIQFIIYLIYPFVVFYFRKFILPKSLLDAERVDLSTVSAPPNIFAQSIVNKKRIIDKDDQSFLLTNDDHGAWHHYHFWYSNPQHFKEGIEGLSSKEGQLFRRPYMHQGPPTSVDVASFYAFSCVLGKQKTGLNYFNKNVAYRWLKYCLGHGDDLGRVSARSSSCGINFVYDGWRGLSQPCTARDYYTSASLFLCAEDVSEGREKFFWKFVYWAHFVLMGGWVWWIQPIMYKDNYIYYQHHVTAVNLYSINSMLKDSWIHKFALRMVDDVSPGRNINPFIKALCFKTKSIIPTYENVSEVFHLLNKMMHFSGDRWQQTPTGNRYVLGKNNSALEYSSVYYMVYDMLSEVEYG